MSHLDGFEGLGNAADLVELDQDGVAAAKLDTLLKALGVGNKEIVADELDLLAELCCHLLPTFPVLLVKTVLDRGDRIFLDKACPMGDKLIGGEILAALGLMIEALAFFALPLGSSGIHSKHEVLAGLVAGGLDGLKDQLDGVLISAEAVGGKAALIADSGNVLHFFDELLEGLEDLSAPAKSLGKGISADGHDHEFLGIN